MTATERNGYKGTPIISGEMVDAYVKEHDIVLREPATNWFKQSPCSNDAVGWVLPNISIPTFPDSFVVHDPPLVGLPDEIWEMIIFEYVLGTCDLYDRKFFEGWNTRRRKRFNRDYAAIRRTCKMFHYILTWQYSNPMTLVDPERWRRLFMIMRFEDDLNVTYSIHDSRWGILLSPGENFFNGENFYLRYVESWACLSFHLHGWTIVINGTFEQDSFIVLLEYSERIASNFVVRIDNEGVTCTIGDTERISIKDPIEGLAPIDQAYKIYAERRTPNYYCYWLHEGEDGKPRIISLAEEFRRVWPLLLANVPVHTEKIPRVKTKREEASKPKDEPVEKPLRRSKRQRVQTICN